MNASPTDKLNKLNGEASNDSNLMFHRVYNNVMNPRDGRTDVIRQAAECLLSDFLNLKLNQN